MAELARSATVGNTMGDDDRVLRELNVQISEAENRGDRKWLEAVLAPKLAFQRADKDQTVEDHVTYLQKVTTGGTRVTLTVEAIEVYGNLAVVRCIVAVSKDRFHNIRLFVRRQGEWKLLGWANEPLY